MAIPLPYALLLLAVMLAPFGRARPALFALTAAVAAGLGDGRLHPVAVPSLLVMAGLARAARGRPVVGVAAFGWALALSNYLLPGFRNPIVFDHVRFTADAAPFTMYFNFDKTAGGLLLYLFVIERPEWPLGAPRVIWRTWATVTAALMFVSLATGYVGFAPKWPDGASVWALNNLFFVCLAEEAVFRGVLQTRLAAWLGRRPAIALAALAFGVQHYQGGPAYVALAAVAGLFYGHAYARTGRLEASMLVHFGLNVTHMAFFTYPSLVR